MYKVLHVYPQLNCGGTEMVFYNLIKFSDRQLFQYEILVQREGEQDQMFKNLGCTIITIPYLNRKQYKKELAVFFSENNYQAVHCHTHKEIPIVLSQAKRAGIRHCISHSHTARIDIPAWLWPLLYLKHRKFEQYATDLFGCSKLALKWLFPTRWKKGVVIHNGIDLDAFQFDNVVRESYRNILGVAPNTKVIINVGRCTEEKNHDFILDRAKDLVSEDCLFVIIGEGPLFSHLQHRVNEEKISNVKMLGKHMDVSCWLCAADLFIFPSIYEGLGIVAIEAQSSGLPVLSTNSIPVEADMGLGIMHRIPLNNINEWNKLLEHITTDSVARVNKSREAYKSKYNIRNVVKEVEQIYRS